MRKLIAGPLMLALVAVFILFGVLHDWAEDGMDALVRWARR